MSERQNTGKRNKMLNSVAQELSKSREKNMCDCCHTRKGDLNLVKAKDRSAPGDLRYICRACEKKINLNKLPERTTVTESGDGKYSVQLGYLDVIEAADNMLDVIKMSLNLENEKEQKIANHMAEAQYRIRNNIPKLYKAALLKNGSGNNNGKHKREENRGWGAPAVSGR